MVLRSIRSDFRWNLIRWNLESGRLENLATPIGEPISSNPCPRFELGTI